MPDLPPPRSYLYCPASSPRLLAGLLARGADAVVLDLEDAVVPERKAEARRAVTAFLDAHASSDVTPVLVRVDRSAPGWSQQDLDAAVRPGLAALRVPKCEDAQELRRLDEAITALERERGLEVGTVGVEVLIESARGVHHAVELASAPRVTRLCFGATDFLADIDGQGPPHGEPTWYARGHLVVASRVAGIAAPVDAVHTVLDDPDGLRGSALVGRRFGFGAKSVIHPSQLEVVHEVFGPDPDAVAWAQRVVAAADRSATRGEGATWLDGDFIDAAVVCRAQRVLAGARREAAR